MVNNIEYQVDIWVIEYQRQATRIYQPIAQFRKIKPDLASCRWFGNSTRSDSQAHRS